MRLCKWLMVVAIMVAVFAPVSYALIDQEVDLAPRVQILSKEINQIEEAIEVRQGEILQLQAEKLKRIGAIEELGRVKEIVERNEALEEAAKVVVEAVGEKDEE